MLVEMRGTLVLDDGVDRKKVPRKLHRPSLFLFGLFLWNISAKKEQSVSTLMASVKMSRTSVPFILNMATLTPDVASQLFV